PPPPPYTPAPATDETKVPVKNETARVLEALGHPGPIADTGYFGSYVSNFNRQLRNPNWVFEHLTAENLRREAGEKDPDRSNSAFREDTRIPMLFRARLKDYFKSGYDRGHMAPAADAKRSQGAMDDTFLLTNMCPQVGMGFNRDYWSHFETFTRRLTKSFSDVYVFTGPLYLPKPIPGSPNKYKVEYEVIGSPPNIAVPTHFYKVILVKNAVGKYSAGGFVLPNAVIPDDAPLESFVLPISAIEKAAGLTFFDKVPEIAIPGASAPLCASTLCSL
ncbi:hypothetical protein BJ085DRAFT_10208, partial [Dimargaris cristalligena]